MVPVNFLPHPDGKLSEHVRGCRAIWEEPFPLLSASLANSPLSEPWWGGRGWGSATRCRFIRAKANDRRLIWPLWPLVAYWLGFPRREGDERRDAEIRASASNIKTLCQNSATKWDDRSVCERPQSARDTDFSTACLLTMRSLTLLAPGLARILDFFSVLPFFFWLTVLQKETQRPGSTFSPQGFRLPLPMFVCARAPPGWFLLTARRYEMYRFLFFIFFAKVWHGSDVHIYSWNTFFLSAGFSLLPCWNIDHSFQAPASLFLYVCASAFTGKIGLIFFFGMLFLQGAKELPQAIFHPLAPTFPAGSGESISTTHCCISRWIRHWCCLPVRPAALRLQLLSERNFDQLLCFLNINQL